MDEFAGWIRQKYPNNRKGQSAIEIADDFPFTFQAWQESAKQKGAEIADLKEVIKILKGSVKSFTDASVDLVARERERIVGDIRVMANDYMDSGSCGEKTIVLEIADRIEESK